MITDPIVLAGVVSAAGVMVGALTTYFWQQRRYAAASQALEQELALAQQQQEQSEVYFNQQLAQRQEALNSAHERLYTLQNERGELSQQAAQLQRLEAEHRQLRQELKDTEQALATLRSEHQAQQASHAQAEQHHADKVAALEGAEQRLQTQFENLANRIFNEKSDAFSKSSQTNLGALLNPLKDQIEGFKRQISDQYTREGQERASLKTEILSLKELNQKITDEAAALTMALKGDNKKQGNWGEVVLERILKESGLREGHEFDTQVSLRAENGKLQQPDVVVHLPNDKDVIIDSKVSLAAYERYFNSDDDASRERALKEHVASVRGHIKGLGAKDYHELKGLKTLDYVLLFIPVEPAFLLAIEEDPQLVSLALNHNIMLVSPTNLLVALRTINNIWQYEYQNQNAQKIAAHAGKLYDKFTGFVQDMDKIGKSIEASQKHYDSAFAKLTSGRGNLVRQAEQFRELGISPSKKLPEALTKEAMQELHWDDQANS